MSVSLPTSGASTRDSWRTNYLSLRHDLKATWIHGFPYLTGRLDWARLPQITKNRPDQSRPVSAEVHILTSYRDWKMALWSVHSLISAAQGSIEVVVHDDGTLPECASRQFRTRFCARIISLAEADSKVEAVLKSQKRLLRLRKRIKHFHKLTDFAFFSTKKRIIVMDSDVLVFREPKELLEGPAGSVPYLFMRDLWSTYDLPPTPSALPPVADRICCGLGNVQCDSLDFERMESFLAVAGIDLDRCDIWIEQTLWALECAASGFEYLSGDYAVAFGPGIGHLACKHYIGGPSRDYFFIDGIQAVKRRGSPTFSCNVPMWGERV
jgi:hypothetical protein